MIRFSGLSKKLMIIICLTVVMTGTALFAENKRPDFFPVSVWYSGGKARAPMLEPVGPQSRIAWKKDLEQIKELGFNTVRTWIEWAACEREEGKYDFSSLELLTDLAAEVGLKVIIQVYIDSAPDWVRLKFPDGRFVSSNGVAVEPQAAPGLCFDHPRVQKKILDFFAAAARVVKDKKAFYGWDLWSEPHIINWAEVYYVGDLRYVQFCYCHSTQARFRDWLQRKYGHIEALNKAWYRSFRSWREVEPPRYGTILTFTDYIDWKEFISDKLAEDLALKAQSVRKIVPQSVVTSHSAIPGLFSRPDWSGTPDDRKMSDSVDFYGASIYPKHAWTIRPWSPFFRAAGLDFSRSMGLKNGGFYIGELQAGIGVFGMKISQPVEASDLRDWMWTTVAYGARSINIYAYYPMSSGYEAGGYGLVELDGKITERARASGKIASVINSHQQLFLKSQPFKSEVAILYIPLSHMVGGQQSFTGEGQPLGVNNLSESLQGVYQTFFQRGIPVDFLHVRDLDQTSPEKYKLLIVPYPVMMSQPDVEKLVKYVEAGGTLVVEARCGWIDERGFSSPVIPGGRLPDVFGAREFDVAPIAKTGTMKVKTTHEALPFLRPGDTLDAAFFAESFEVTGKSSLVLAEYDNGKPAMVLSSYGRGKAIIAGSFLGLAYYHFRNPNNASFFSGLASWLNIKPAIEVESSDPKILLEARFLEGENFKIFFAFNRGEKHSVGKFKLKFPAGEVEAQDLESGARIPLLLEKDKIVLSKKLEAGEVWVVVLKSK